MSVLHVVATKPSPPPTGQLMTTYFKFVDDTEAPTLFHRWCILSALGAYLGRQYWFPFGEFSIFPNQYVMLIGDPGTRKSTAIKLAKSVLSATGYDTFSAERTSKEKFLLDLEGMEEGADAGNSVMRNILGDDYETGMAKEVFVAADEFNEFVGSGNMEFLSLLGSLWDWDNPLAPFKQRLKTSRSISIYQPTISILSGNTHAGFSEAFPPQAVGQGFLSRLILVYGESTGKRITFPKKPDPAIKEQLSDMFLEIRKSVTGEAKVSVKARDMLESGIL